VSGREFARKRPGWVVWVPTLVLVALIAGAGVLAWLVSTGGVGRTEPPTVEEAVTADGYSRFSEQGAAYVRDSLQARVDLSTPSPDAVALGLPRDGTTTVEADGFTVSVGLYVGEESIRVPAQSMTLTTRDGALVRLVLHVDGASYSDLSARLVDLAERFAIDLGPLDAIDSRVARAVRDESTDAFSFGPGAGFGRPATALLNVGESGATTLALDIDFSS
jgi:hypothetical protein